MTELHQAAPPEGHLPEASGSHPIKFPVVGIGASAGGLDAFSQLLSCLPTVTGMAFVLIQHLEPNTPSLLPELLAKQTSIPVYRATDGQKVRPDRIYIISEGDDLTIEAGCLRVSRRDPEGGMNHLIDRFFASLAAECREWAIGVILSGTGFDGTQGLAEIKKVGGMVFVQDSGSAKFPEMPVHAFDSGGVDLVLSPEKIARELVEVSHSAYFATDGEGGGAGRGELEQEDGYSRVLELLKSGHGVDFADYRDNTIRRRMGRRMALRHMDSLSEYGEYLENNPSELAALYGDILINVTRFFRESEVFEALKTLVFPEILKDKTCETPVRIWVPGCSSGQEVYSLAIVLFEYLETQKVRPPVQIFGTDLSDSAAIQRAREGVYPDSIASEISKERLERFFTREGNVYRVGRNIRELCTFARHNVAGDPPFSRMDLVSCRNLLIYFSATLQKRVIPALHYALNSNGFLLLGAAEAVGRFTDMFRLEESKFKIYSKVSGVVRVYPHFTGGILSSSRVRALPVGSGRPILNELKKEADRILLSRFAPAGVLVSDELEVLQFRGRTGPYLEPAPGEASFQLLRMVRESLFAPIRTAVEEARNTGRGVLKKGICFRDEVAMRLVDLEVIPVKIAGGQRGGFLVVFESGQNVDQPRRDLVGESLEPLEDGETHLLRQELRQAKEYSQSILEQHIETNRELCSTNDELLSVNEELQSTNEELQTSKEELFSTNEEITTVNEELQNRNQDLASARDDLVNFLSSVEIPLMIFGADLRIRRFTPAAERMLGLRGTDIGRSIATIRLPLTIPHIEALIRDVILSGTPQEREVQKNSGRWYLLRIQPYRTQEQGIAGAVAVWMDINEVRLVREELRAARDYALAIVDTTTRPLIILNTDLRIVTINRAFEITFKLNRAACVGGLFFEAGNGQWDSPILRGMLTDILENGVSFTGFQVEHEFPHIGRRVMLLNAKRMIECGRPQELLIGFEDITERQDEDVLKLAHLTEMLAANAAKDQFLAALSHELRTPLTPVLLSASALEGRVDLPEDVRREIGMIRGNVELEAQLIDDLLDITRATQGKLAVTLLSENVCEVLDRAVQVVRELAEQKGVKMEVVIAAKDYRILCDVKRVMQVFWNVLNNAIKFTPPGGAITIHVTNAQFQRVRITFEDNGIGVSHEVLPLMFNAFQQGSPNITKEFGGLGLGLTIAKAITELHGGKIWAESPGSKGGTSVILEFPTIAPTETDSVAA